MHSPSVLTEHVSLNLARFFLLDPVNIAVKFSVDPSYDASISGGPLSGSYKLDHFVLHWGSTQGQGSEHTLEDER